MQPRATDPRYLETDPQKRLMDGFDPMPGVPLIAVQYKLQAILDASWKVRMDREQREAERYNQPFHLEPSPSLNSEAFEFAPWGDRLVVVREKAASRQGGIIIPDTSRGFPASGWVLSVGEAVELPTGAAGRRCPLPRARLLGCKVVFPSYGGGVLVMSDDVLSDNFRSPYSVLAASDIWGTVGEPPAEVPL